MSKQQDTTPATQQCLATTKTETRKYVTTHFCAKAKGHEGMHRAETPKVVLAW